MLHANFSYNNIYDSTIYDSTVYNLTTKTNHEKLMNCTVEITFTNNPISTLLAIQQEFYPDMRSEEDGGIPKPQPHNKFIFLAYKVSQELEEYDLSNRRISYLLYPYIFIYCCTFIKLEKCLNHTPVSCVVR